jgi:hypothetical protein
VLASLLRSKLIDRRRLGEATLELACLLGSRHRTNVRMLRETNRIEEDGLSFEDLPLLAKSIRIVKDGVTVTGEHAAHCEIAHKANTVKKVLTLTLLNQDRNKILVGLELDALVNIHMDFKDMLLVGGLSVRERESRELGRQCSASHTVPPVDSLTLDFKNIRANPENGARNVGYVTTHLRTDVDIQAQARPELVGLDKNKITLPVEVKTLSAPGLEMRITVATSISWGTGGSDSRP